MSREHHARVKELFLAAREQPPALRPEYLAARCGGNADLQREVESLLERLENLEVAEPAADSEPLRDNSVTEEYPGRTDATLRVTNYRVLQKVGEGGMGEVYEAEQQSPVKRRVALKVLKGGLATREVIARFDSERQALAMMNHPSIAQVFEAGATERGRPFFAMELVHGEPITLYCNRHRLPNRERLDLFEKVCVGVQHAHQKGIIHRDLKPSNILVTLVDGKPVPKIIDFGIAKATVQPLTESTLFTQIGQWIGTPEYMSPEQAEMSSLDIDTRSDVYSLGVLLYELLAGTRPFDSDEFRRAGFDEMRRRIREEEPTRPSLKVSGLRDESLPAAQDRQTDVDGLVLQLSGDLDWITMRALEKDRTRRYASPSELAADIRRHLELQPVLACPPSNLYRARKFVRRNRLGVIAASLVTGAILLGLVTTSFALLHARREARRATQVAAFLEDIIGDSNPFVQTTAATLEGQLDQAVSRLETELSDQPLVQARLRRRIGTVYRDLGRFDRAESLLQRSLSAFEEEYGRHHLDTADGFRELAWLAWEAGDYPRHERHINDYVDILLRIVDREDSRIGPAETDLAFSAWAMGHYDQAAELYARALSRIEGVPEPDQLFVARNLQLQGVLYNSSGDYRKGRVAAERSLSLRAALLGNDSLQTAWSRRILARTQRLQGDYQEALVSAQQSLDTMEKRLGPDHSDLAFSLSTLGLTYSDLGDFVSARPLLERGLTLRENTLGPEHAEVGLSLIKLAWLHLEMGDPVAAEPLIERSLDIGRRAFPPAHPQIAWRLHALSRQRVLSGQLEEALAVQQQALAMLEPGRGPSSPGLAAHLSNLGVIQRDLGHLVLAQTLLERALALREGQLGPRHRRIADDHFELGKLHALLGEIGLAHEEMQSALEMYRVTVGNEHPALDRCLLAMEELPARPKPSR